MSASLISGGVTPEDLQAFVQIGNSGSASGETPTIGIWGQGQKQALAALGRDVTISTRYWQPGVTYTVPGETAESHPDQVVLHMDPEWWADEENWDIPVCAPPYDLERGYTTYSISRLNRPITPEMVEEIKKALQGIYRDLLAEQKEIAITINDEELERTPHLSEDALQNIFAYPPGYEPARHWYPLEWQTLEREGDDIKTRTHKLRMEIIVGLMPKQDKKVAGVYMVGVPTDGTTTIGPRRFEGPLQDESVGYNDGPNSSLRKNDPTLGRLVLYAVFHGRSEDIPWGCRAAR